MCAVDILITDRVRSTTGRLCFDTCLSICLSTPGGGTPGRSRWGGVPLPGGVPPAGGTPPQIPPSQTWPGVPLPGGTPPQVTPHWTWLGVTPCPGYPTSGTPPPIGPGRGKGGTPPQVIDGVLDTPRSVCLLRSRRRTFLFLGLA